ncbi:MAG TPA: DUF4190 domain-containing protein [Phycisphaerae bacterium]|nr:DUF4190 domain-containing protein [Phycisphaerae bacterium]HOI55848.1 DUF4190 domain-containing protein [Phycisphaerae bacterium]
MAIQFTCPSCHQAMTVSEQYAGREVFCPTCRAQLTVPQQSGGQSEMIRGGVVGAQGSPAAGTQSVAGATYGPGAAAAGVAPMLAAPRSCGMATASLVLSIVSWICCVGPIGSLPGFILGLAARGKVKRSGGTLTGKGRATAGVIISLLNLLLIGGTLIAFVSVPVLRNSAVSGYRLGVLNQACTVYTMSHGTMPPDLQTLVDQGMLSDTRAITCPLSGEEYVYTAAGMSQMDLHRGVVIAYSKGKPVEGMRLALCWGGQVELMEAAELKSRLRAQGTPEELIP